MRRTASGTKRDQTGVNGTKTEIPTYPRCAADVPPEGIRISLRDTNSQTFVNRRKVSQSFAHRRKVRGGYPTPAKRSNRNSRCGFQHPQHSTINPQPAGEAPPFPLLPPVKSLVSDPQHSAEGRSELRDVLF
ncbi:MAG: hypothetical protein JWO95_744 [Verrucomicrobiales bacterium]|nr:hypothetical protein [Verrucomicrobiales bacterium]